MNFVKQKTNIEIVNKYLDMYEDIDTLILSTAALAGFFGISQSGLQAGKVSKTKEGLTLVPLNTLDAMMAIAGHCTRLDSAKTYLDRNKDTKDIHLSCRKIILDSGVKGIMKKQKTSQSTKQSTTSLLTTLSNTTKN